MIVWCISVCHINAVIVMVSPAAVELAQSISWPDGLNGDLNQAFVSLGLVEFCLCS